MIKNLAVKIVDWQIKRNTLQKEEHGLYLYAYEILINQTINILIAIALAILFRAPLSVFVFLIAYIPLRAFCGGHHAKTNEGCIIVSAIMICIICVTVQMLPGNANDIIPPIAFLISGLMIFKYAPVPDSNKPLSDEEIVRYRKISRKIWLAETAIGMILYFTRSTAGTVIALSHIMLCVMIGWAILKDKKRNKK